MTARRPPPVLLRSLRLIQTGVWIAACILAVGAFGNAVAAPLPEVPAKVLSDARIAPEIMHTVAPHHPPALREKLINGEAEIECLIGDNGQILEATITSATHPEFGEAALEAVRQWQFKAGERDGQPAAMRVKIPISFELSPEAMLESLARRPVYVEISETIVKAEQLPAWPMPRKYHLPAYPKELRGSGKRGKAVVAIVINKEGRVINPKVVKSSYPEFILPSLVAALALEFSPQRMANKEAMYVSMEVQYDFTAKGGQPKAVSPASAPPPAPKKKPGTN